MSDERDDGKTGSGKLWTPGGERAEESAPRQERVEGEEELSEEELRRRIEEAMEKITVADVVLDMMISLSSLAYQRMGIPKDVNEKYRDMDQARLAIDCLDALAGAMQDRVPPEHIDPLKSTITNLKLNFAKES